MCMYGREGTFVLKIAFARSELDVFNFIFFVLMVAKSMRSFFTDKRNKGRFKYPWKFFL